MSVSPMGAASQTWLTARLSTQLLAHIHFKNNIKKKRREHNIKKGGKTNDEISTFPVPPLSHTDIVDLYDAFSTIIFS